MIERENDTKFAILAILAWHPSSGYDIKKFLNEMVNHIWTVSFGQIYPLLKECEAQGLVKSKFLEQHGKPDKSVYHITKKGLKELQLWMKREVSHTGIRSKLLLKLGMCTPSDVETAKDHIQNYKKTVTEKMSEYDKLISEKRKICPKDEMIFIEIIADYLISHLKMELEWAQKSIKKLKNI